MNGAGNDHCATGYSFEFLAGASAQVQPHSIPAVTYQDQHGMLGRTPEHHQNAQRSLPSSFLTSRDNDPQQPTADSFESDLRDMGYQVEDGGISEPQSAKHSSLSCAPPSPTFGVLRNSPVEANPTNVETTGSEATKLRRQRNSAAARKYRQRRLDRIEELEHALQKTQTERDELKVQVARWRGKAEALQALMASSGMEKYG